MNLFWSESEPAGLMSRSWQRCQRAFHPLSLRASELGESAGETEAILIALAQAVEQRDPHTARHCERLAGLSHFPSVSRRSAGEFSMPSTRALEKRFG